MHIAVCEDEQVYVDGMLHAINVWSHNQHHQDVTVEVYPLAEDLWDAWEKGRVFDALFLDIEFKFMSGFTLAQKIRQTDENIPIIFVTNSDRYILSGYEVSAYRYIKKPIVTAQIGACLDYCYRCTSLRVDEGFLIMRKGYTIRMPYRDVLYIVSGIHAATIHTTNGKTHTMYVAGSFTAFAESFPKEIFVRCHRGYIISLAAVRKFTKAVVTLLDGTEIPIGRLYCEETIDRLNQFFLKEIHV